MCGQPSAPLGAGLGMEDRIVELPRGRVIRSGRQFIAQRQSGDVGVDRWKVEAAFRSHRRSCHGDRARAIQTVARHRPAGQAAFPDAFVVPSSELLSDIMQNSDVAESELLVELDARPIG